MTHFVPAYTKQGRQIASQNRRPRFEAAASAPATLERRNDQAQWNREAEARRRRRIEKRLLKEHFEDL